MSTAVLDAPATHPTVAALRRAQSVVEQIKNDQPQQFPEAASVGDAVRQGDIYIQLIPDVDKAPMLYELATPSFPMQLAEGNTKGSRHCLAHGDGVTVFQPVARDSDAMMQQLAKQHGLTAADADWRTKLNNAEWEIRRRNNFNADTATGAGIVFTQDARALLEFAGPIFRLEKPNTVTHPEHGDWLLPPGTYRITYQRTIARDNTVARVLD
jgi:hypothetical protein